MENLANSGDSSTARVCLTWQNVNAALPEVKSAFRKSILPRKVILKNSKLNYT